MKVERHGVTLELVRGDIAAQEGFDAVVNAANAQLMPGGGVAGAIHRAAGPALAEECRPLAPIAPGEAVLTGGHGLPNRYVIHCLGPVYGRDEPAEILLRSCYRRALELAEDHGLASVAFPALSTGAFGYPLREAARAALDEVLERLPELRSVRRVRFALFGADALAAHREALEALLEPGGLGGPAPGSP
jgi:O-acetyl-ADP-ribose deacetylase (regulator of RNase III)